ncbi:hypothetical protein V2G26_014411 [Clonostachys chloroleuca]
MGQGPWQLATGCSPRRRRSLQQTRPRQLRRPSARWKGASRGSPPRNESRRTASPPPKKREPTPDLTDIVSVLDRKRRLTQWDIKPPGYDFVTAEQAKLSGMFPLPGAPRQQPVDQQSSRHSTSLVDKFPALACSPAVLDSRSV